MTTNIRRGDRVRAVSTTNSDFSEFTVDDIAIDGSLASKENFFSIGKFAFEKIEHPRPTVPGLYSFTGGGGRHLMLTDREEFFLVDFTAPGEDVCVPLNEEVDVREFFSKYTFVLNYKHENSASERPVVRA